MKNYVPHAILLSLLIVNCIPLQTNHITSNNQVETGIVHSQLDSFSYTVIDTGQTKCYDNTQQIPYPLENQTFFGQDAQYQGVQMSYQDNEDGTVTDSNTGLMWQQSPGEKVTFVDAVANADAFELAGYTDWRLPTIKELYSLIDFSGITGMRAEDSVPYINTDYFDFEYGDESIDERFIDSQYCSSTEYVSTTMDGDHTVFGVNFADGRIKGYGTEMRAGITKTFFVMYVRGNTDYGDNEFVNNDDGTITDQATNLMWVQNDSMEGMNWETALDWVQELNVDNYLGHNDWRLPNAKELQSIVDYSKAPDVTDSAAIDPVFNCTVILDESGETNYPFYWTSTTHLDGPDARSAVYIAFGEALGWMTNIGGDDYTLMDVHGAGAQRSDPKSGDPSDYPYGFGPQGDVRRIYNYVRVVRGGSAEIITEEPSGSDAPLDFPVTQIVILVGFICFVLIGGAIVKHRRNMGG